MSSDVLERQRDLIRAMTPEQKVRAVEALYRMAWDLKAAWLRTLHPEWPEAEVQEEVRRLFRDVGPA